MDRLQPRPHFFIQRSRQEPQLIAHRYDGAADGDAVVFAVEHLVQASGHCDEGLSGASVTVTGDERNFGIQQRVDQAALAEIERLERLAVGDFEGFGYFQPDKAAMGCESGRDGLFLASA